MAFASGPVRIAILLTATSIPLAAFSEDDVSYCAPSGDIPLFFDRENILSLLGASQVPEGSFSISNFCYDTEKAGREDDARSLLPEGTSLEALRESDLKRKLLAVKPTHNAWKASMFPSLNVHYAAWLAETSEPDINRDKASAVSRFENAGPEATQQIRDYEFDRGAVEPPFSEIAGPAALKRFLSTPGAQLPTKQTRADTLRRIQEIESNQDNTFGLRKIAASAGSGWKKRSAFQYACLKYGVMDSSQCAKGLDSIVGFLLPRGGSLTPFTVIKKVLTDPTFVEGARKAALTIMSRVEKGLSGKPVEGSLLDDIRSSYIEAGLSPKEADSHAWDLIAVLSGITEIGKLHGFLDRENSALIPAMQLISVGIPLLNSLSEGTGHAYAYPPNVTTTCGYYKFYHFWMSAYLARKLAAETGNPAAARSASYLADVFYQMLSSTVGRDPTRAFTAPTFDDANNHIRLDLAFGAAGAAYGSSYGTAKEKDTLDLDQSIRKLLMGAGFLPTLPAEEAKRLWEGTKFQGYTRWQYIFAPEEALKAHP